MNTELEQLKRAWDEATARRVEAQREESIARRRYAALYAAMHQEPPAGVEGFAWGDV